MSYEVWGEPEEYPECPHCEENARITDNLAMLVAQLVRALRKAAPEHDLPARALDYLQREGLIESPLRETPSVELTGWPAGQSGLNDLLGICPERMTMFDEEPDGDPHGECAAEIHRLNAELAKCAEALPGPCYMDPPDGGDVAVSEQLRRMAEDAARYRWLRKNNGYSIRCDLFGEVGMREHADADLDALIDAHVTPNAELRGRPLADGPA